MKAEWKKSPLERAKRKEPLQDAAQRIAELERQVKTLRTECEERKRKQHHMVDVTLRMEKQRDEAVEKAQMFDFLCRQEVMLAGAGGFELFTGKALEAYCRDRWLYKGLANKYTSALAQSMIQSKTAALEAIINNTFSNHVFYPGIQSQETNSQDA